MDKIELRDAFEAGRYEQTDNGIVFPREGILARGLWCVSKRGEPDEYYPNLIVNQGLDYMLGAALGAQTPVTSWYIALFSGDVAVQPSWTAANFVANATEITAYTQAARPAWNAAAVSGQAISSFATKAAFTANATITARGAALVSNSTKSSTAGTLMAAARFGTDKGLTSGEELDVGYQISLTAS